MMDLHSVAIENTTPLLNQLEQDELEAAGSGVPVKVYAQMLAFYLYQHDLCNAKFLWKRIPTETKTSNPELSSIWNVGQKMWQRDIPAIYTAIASRAWSEPVSPIMEKITEHVRDSVSNLVSYAYSSIRLHDYATLVGLGQEAAKQLVVDKGWRLEEGEMIIPVRPAPPSGTPTPSEEQLKRLTEFVSFLEN